MLVTPRGKLSRLGSVLRVLSDRVLGLHSLVLPHSKLRLALPGSYSKLLAQQLLDAGASVDAEDMHGDTPLSWASWHTRPDSILLKLCYGEFQIHPARNSTFDHGSGWGYMELDLLGRPQRD